MIVTPVNSSVISTPNSYSPSSDRTALAEPARQGAAAPEVPAKAVQAVEETVKPEQMKSAVEKINQTVKQMASNIEFTIDEDTGIHVVKVVDKETKNVIRQMPSKEVLAIAKALDQLQGLIIRQKA